jgi:hypothetical protein
MRTLILLLATLTGGIAGYFAGGYSFNAAHPAAPIAAPSPTGNPLHGLQSAQARVAAALDRHQARQTWIAIGAGTGLLVGFLGTIIAYKLSARRVLPKIASP